MAIDLIQLRDVRSEEVVYNCDLRIHVELLIGSYQEYTVDVCPLELRDPVSIPRVSEVLGIGILARGEGRVVKKCGHTESKQASLGEGKIQADNGLSGDIEELVGAGDIVDEIVVELALERSCIVDMEEIEYFYVLLHTDTDATLRRTFKRCIKEEKAHRISPWISVTFSVAFLTTCCWVGSP
jgi:hypothetical protein